MKTILQLFIALAFITSIHAQRNLKNSILGKIIDSKEAVPLEYANIVIFRTSDSLQITGTVTDKNGNFIIKSLRPDNYYARISFIGYESKYIDGLKINSRTNLDLGTIKLIPYQLNTDEVVISGNRSPVTYQIDKKIIDVSGQITALSGNAIDLLENVPSITVDIEGNVSLRGSTNFTVLIDGKPSILDGSEALEHIPATSIENIEIITNPSAKYNPEGTSGIINIISKRNKLQGISGISNLNGGDNGSYGGDVLLDYKNQLLDFSLGLDYNKRNRDMDSESNSWTSFNDNIFYNNSYGTNNRGRKSYSIKSALALNFSKKDVLTLKSRYGYRSRFMNSDLFYSQWNGSEIDKLDFMTVNDRLRDGTYYSLGLNYFHNFLSKNHTVSFDLIYQKRNSDEYTIYKQLDNLDNITEGQKQTEEGPSNRLEIKLDYELPLTKNSKFESGYNGSLNSSDDYSENLIFNTETSKFESNELYSTDVTYDRNVHSIYSIYSHNLNDKLGIQIGLRGEYTDRNIDLNSTHESFNINRWDYFPSGHFSYKFNPTNQLMASYTRRINRPRGWQLEPFLTWMDTYNVRKGNPDLKPEYIDSYELGYQTLFGKSVVSTELYYRKTNNKSEYIQFPYDENVTLRTVDNVGKSYAFGTELMFNFDLVNFWNVNLMGNLYNYKIKGSLDNLSFDRENFTWNTRLNNTIYLSKNTQIQVNLFYNSPTVSAQGDRKGYTMTNAAIKQNLFNRKLTLTLQVRDLFGTSKREMTTSSDDFYRYSYFAPDTPIVMFNLRFNFNNFNSKKRPGERAGSGFDVDGGEDF